ncbi:RNA polymerase sigma-70 factor [Tamlana sp. 2201CG12-4]|uniref:RNA polymerase sigma factor n=1 Tax=Tamlana sp. 2201CG12-4 TaxID=3112582 RepID=UPI002DB9DFCD|nr:RNA polymerase sigma-70 factor [Tamlana sp. 2201CG12-4]MEC3908668.1 RNA polymerase sigma-70 factor [Tamlana sp. 2201CG12-4]
MISEKTNSDKLLLLEFKKGNEKVFRKLFDLFWEPMFINAKSIVMDENVAKDIVQNVWINLWNHRESKDIKNFKGYVFKAVNNGCYKYLRDNKFNKIQLDSIESLALPSKPLVEKHYDLEDTQIAIENSLSNLPPRCQQIFRLSRMEELSNEEIALHLGISKRSVENQLSKALKLIRQHLSVIQSFLISVMLILVLNILPV